MTQAVSALIDVRRVSDAELISRLHRLVSSERMLSTKLLVHIGEVDARGLYRDAAFSSMFAYCVAKLHMSDAEALLRIYAARQGRAYPRVLELHAQSVLHLTAIKLIGPHLTPDNHVQLLERVRCKSRREVELIVAEIAPKPDVPSSLTRAKLASSSLAQTTRTESVQAITPEPPIAAPNAFPAVDAAQSTPAQRLSAIESASAGSMIEASPLDVAANSASSSPRSGFTLSSPPRPSTTPLSPGRFKLQVTLGQEAYDKLQQLRDLSRHRDPSGDLAALIERALDLLLERTLKQRFALGGAAKRSTATKPSSIGEGAPTRSTQSDLARDADPERCVRNEPASVHPTQSDLARDTEQHRCVRNEPASVHSTQSDLVGDAEPASARGLRNELASRRSMLAEPVGDPALASARAARDELASPHAMLAEPMGDLVLEPARGARNELASPCSMLADPADDPALASARAARDELASPRAMLAEPVGGDEPESARCVRNELASLRSRRAVMGCGAELAPARLAVVRGEEAKRKSRYVPRAVVRDVYLRDGGQCTFVSAEGRRCLARGFLELHHHVVTFALGGAASVENLRLACRAHNALWAEWELGRAFIDAKRAGLPAANTR